MASSRKRIKSVPEKIINKRMARSRGLDYYMTGVACLNGHVSRRDLKTGRCFMCDGGTKWLRRKEKGDRKYQPRRNIIKKPEYKPTAAEEQYRADNPEVYSEELDWAREKAERSERRDRDHALDKAYRRHEKRMVNRRKKLDALFEKSRGISIKQCQREQDQILLRHEELLDDKTKKNAYDLRRSREAAIKDAKGRLWVDDDGVIQNND